MVSSGIAKASVKRIAFEATGSSIGKDAVDALCSLTEAYIKEQALKADKLAKHAGRKTIKAVDIQ